MSCACSLEPRHLVKLLNVEHLGGDTYNFDFVSDTLEQWQEGDSSKLYVPIEDRTPGKKFSFATLPDEGVIRFTTRLKSRESASPSVYKQGLFQLQPGAAIEITAPKGEFFLRRHQRPVVLLSNGVGIAAVRALIKAYQENQEGIPYLVQLNVDATGEIYGEEFRQIQESVLTFQSLYANSRQAFQEKLEDILEAMQLAYLQPPYFYVVGSESFVRQSVTWLELSGYEQGDMILDQNGGCGCSLPVVVQLQDLS